MLQSDADPHHGEANHGMLHFVQKEKDQLHQQNELLNYDLWNYYNDNYVMKLLNNRNHEYKTYIWYQLEIRKESME